MKKEKIVKGVTEKVTDYFREYCKRGKYSTPVSSKNYPLDAHEMSDEVVRDIVSKFFDITNFTDAREYIYNAVKEYIKGGYDDIDWTLPEEEAEKTREYIQWDRQWRVECEWHHACDDVFVLDRWVDIYGMTHTDEEAATIAADAWCSKIFGWHFQDNGAADDKNGFNMCALGTILANKANLANKAKENIPEEVQKKAHGLIHRFYLTSIGYLRGEYDCVRWFSDNLPDDRTDITEDRRYDWTNGYTFLSGLTCDYGPCMSLYLILKYAGVPENDISSICPRKTTIGVRKEDNGVCVSTYGKTEYR